ncbi:MAG: hypothetical protein A3C38_00505 [Planctomycetes bacterium RIFCSPHIGHO2_02_FULL_50_42]|uniref:hypothetical protein n=1 Tax=Candidatus Avalokitesvara rifleensis TaxID=3367620 RepID=UPI0008C52CC9|nr:hypothetical protein [Candidatus Brocadiales bacterium]OHB89729.1 MAG: hypothetical protein A3C38_00505 [Planctomycetes bacterium RIFCSPHIGHO2_02_FULL_50_42]OHB91648.1 MAG: hypothetical protein A3E75_01250 [Planctomycetes bacterium RIFCSPHIGHO2_12_FULL_51_37]OHB94850.1 MAG: hypothetical protein A3I59_08640 [Planctomycetes bacterium RIFCSPLOWO2_02_FULL_50_16]OHC03125.1 MAG: hypothetical protein A3G17_02615 [Planctomycetes bacterium RIFCSPLOWO2_12_FULL_50_35]HCN19224.1 hypothetical protein [P
MRYEEPFKVKIERGEPVTVQIPLNGKIIKWHKENSDQVFDGELLCTIKWGTIIYSGITEVTSPAAGSLLIELKEGSDIEGGGRSTTIAYILRWK